MTEEQRLIPINGGQDVSFLFDDRKLSLFVYIEPVIILCSWSGFFME
jgi:hypothetical protein